MASVNILITKYSVTGNKKTQRYTITRKINVTSQNASISFAEVVAITFNFQFPYGAGLIQPL